MFSLIRELGIRVALKQEAIPFFLALVIAEFFFKLGSFTLECIAFLATWCALSFIQSILFPRATQQADHA